MTQTKKPISAKKFIKQYLPDPATIRHNKHLKIFGSRLHDANLWHLNRYCVATAVSIGLFVGYIPAVGHMLAAAFLAILFRANLPLSIALVWVANPFTMPPMYYFGYKLGGWILHIPLQPFHFEMSVHWMLNELVAIFKPMLLGCLICGVILAVLGNIAARLFWRCNVTKVWQRRLKARSAVAAS
jgi:uncharacterized protein (DUF2062 family)